MGARARQRSDGRPSHAKGIAHLRKPAREAARLARHVLAGGVIGRDEALLLMAHPDVYELAMWARRITERFHGKRVDCCSIISARSGRCPEDCRFCAQSAHWTTNAPLHPLLPPERILDAARNARAAGAGRFDVVVSGADAGEDFDAICQVLAEVRRDTGLETCASLGSLTGERARRLRESGVTRYNHNVETTRARYPEIVSTHRYEDRVATIRLVKESGIELCCGCIIGMGESPEDRVDLALELRDLEPDAVPINVLNPIPGTPLEHMPPIPPLEIIRTIAMFRFVMPRTILKYGGGRERNLRDLQALGMVAGINGLILGNYLTTTGRPPAEDLQMIRDLGLEPAA